MEWLKVYEEFDELSKTDKHMLFEAIKEVLFPPEKSDISKLTDEIRESRFCDGLGCLHCGSVSVKRNGKYRSRQRYLCKDCGRSFNDMTASPLSGTHYPHKWLQYFECMVDSMSLPKIAKKLKIHISTAFYWRHKILTALRSLGNQQLSGVIESDETFILESEKGKRVITHRKSRKRGGTATKRGISKEQVCVVVAMDRNGQIISQNAGFGRITATEIDSVLGEFIVASSVLCTDEATNYKKFAQEKGISHEMINASKGIYVKKNIYHIQHVNSYHRRLKDWIDGFQGVATKYLNNYLFWFRFLEQQKKLPEKEIRQSLLLNACKRANHTTIQSLKPA